MKRHPRDPDQDPPEQRGEAKQPPALNPTCAAILARILAFQRVREPA